MRFGLIDDSGDDDLEQLDEAWIANKQPTSENSQPPSSLTFTSSQPQPIPKGKSAPAAPTTALSPSTGYAGLSTHWHSPQSFNSFRCPSSEEEDSSDDELLTELNALTYKQPGTSSLSTSLVNTTSPNARPHGDESPHMGLSYRHASLPIEQSYMSPLATRMRSASPVTTHTKSLQWSQNDTEGNSLIYTPLSRSAPRLRTQARHRINAALSVKDEPEAVLMKYVNYVDVQEVIIKEAKRAGKAAAADKAIQVRQEKTRIREESIRNQEQYMQQIYRATEEATEALEKLLLNSDEKERQAEHSLASRKVAMFSKLDGALAQLEREREEELKRKKAAEKALEKQKAKEEEERREREAKLEEERKEAAIANERSKRTRSATTDMLSFIKDFNEQIKPEIANNPGFKKICFEGRMKIKPKIGQITNTRSQIDRIVNELNQLFNQAQQISPSVYYFLMNFFAKSVVKQAEAEVRVKLSSAFPLARMCVALFIEHPPLIKFMIGRLMKNCPYVIPDYIIRQPGQSDEAYHKALGYASNEEAEQYKERMCGIVGLFSAIVQTTPSGNYPNPYGMMNGWRWLACILNRSARTITPMLINTFLEVAGPALLEVYGDQARKLLQFVIQDYMPRLPPKSLAANSRLQSFLEEYMVSGRIKEITGRQYT